MQYLGTVTTIFENLTHIYHAPIEAITNNAKTPKMPADPRIARVQVPRDQAPKVAQALVSSACKYVIAVDMPDDPDSGDYFENCMSSALDSVDLDQNASDQMFVTWYDNADEAFWFAAALVHDNNPDLATLVCLSDVTHTGHLKKMIDRINDGRSPSADEAL